MTQPNMPDGCLSASPYDSPRIQRCTELHEELEHGIGMAQKAISDLMEEFGASRDTKRILDWLVERLNETIHSDDPASLTIAHWLVDRIDDVREDLV